MLFKRLKFIFPAFTSLCECLSPWYLGACLLTLVTELHQSTSSAAEKPKAKKIIEDSNL